jgi:hypothetical protein
MNAILTSMEAALLRGMGLSEPRVERSGRDFVAVIVRPSGKTIEALGRDPEAATRNVIKMAVRK